jgi:hypothetical protein
MGGLLDGTRLDGTLYKHAIGSTPEDFYNAITI